MTVNKQELINFVEGFNGSSITKQDVLDFIARSNETKLIVYYSDIKVNGGEMQGWYSEQTLKQALRNNDFAKKVVVNFEDDDDDNALTRQEVLTVVEFFIDEDYKLTYVDTDGLEFKKD